METFILLSRSILDSEVFANEKMLKIWLWCLAKASHKKRFLSISIGRGVKSVELERGQFLFGRNTASDELSIQPTTIYKIIKRLEEMGNITIESDNHYSVISICNYDHYQNTDNYGVTANEQPSDSQVTAKGQQSDSRMTTERQQSDTNNELNKQNKLKELKQYSTEIKDLCECFLIAKIDQYEQDGLKPPKCLKPSNDQLNKWYEAIEKLTRIDGYPVDEIRPVIMATLTDEFLSKNVLTLGKLRNKWKDGKTCFEHCYETFKGSPTARTKDNDDPYADVDGETMFMSAEDHLKASQY